MKHIKGQIMVETMVALGMVVIGLLGLLSLLSSSIGINRVLSDQYIGTYLASEGIEVVKNIIDSNVAAGKGYNNGLDGCTTGCVFQYDSSAPMNKSVNTPILFDAQNNVYSYDNGSQTPFSRSVTITPGDRDELIVTSHVTWTTRGSITQDVTLEDHFYNWR